MGSMLGKTEAVPVEDGNDIIVINPGWSSVIVLFLVALAFGIGAWCGWKLHIQYLAYGRAVQPRVTQEMGTQSQTTYDVHATRPRFKALAENMYLISLTGTV